MKRASLALVGLVCACAAATPQAGRPLASPVAAVTPSPSALAASTVIPFSPPGFKCRLPITLFSGDALRGAFIDFPSGAVTRDPATAEIDAIPQPGRQLIDKTYGLYFDKAYARWLPVYRNAVAPDGAHYAYTDRGISLGQTTSAGDVLHVVDVKTGMDSTFSLGPVDLSFVVVDYASDGIYYRAAGSLGIDFVDPVKDELYRPISAIAEYEGSSGDGLDWVGATNPDGYSPDEPNELDKVNPVDLSQVVWFHQPGGTVYFVTQDPQGRPIIMVTTGEINSEEYLYLPSPGVSRQILRSAGHVPAISQPIADSHGVWFGARDGIYLYTVRDGLRQVSRQAGIPANGCV